MAAEEKLSNLDTWRTKVYRLNDNGKWDDQGTGHVTVVYLEGSKEQGLHVIDEEHNDTLLLHRISSDDIYRKQEDTIISWRDLEYGTEFALSFQGAIGCFCIWYRIKQAQDLMFFVTIRKKWRKLAIIVLFTSSLVLNRRNVVSGGQDKPSGSRKQCNVRTLDIEYEISHEVLHQHAGKKLKDVAADLGVSRSTLKRICRKHHIFRWPPSKAKRHNHQELVQATPGSTEEYSQRMQPVCNVPLEKDSASDMQTMAEAKLSQDDNGIMVKATFKDDIIKFQLSLESRKLDLENAVTMRLNLSVGSFKIKYLDEDGDWVLISCDADLRTCLASVGKNTIKMLIATF